MKVSLNALAAMLGALGFAISGQPNCAAQCGLGGVIKSGTSRATLIVDSVNLDSDCKHYSGPFTLTATGTSGQPATVFKGLLTATRITLDTAVADIL